MGADIKKLRTRIKSVNSTLHLTKAMGLVASSKIRKANDAMNRAKSYEKAISDIMAQLTSCEECIRSPYMAERTEGKLKLIVIAGDRGLAGGYNANIFRLMKDYPDADVTPIGKRACDRYSGDLKYAENFGSADAKKLADALCSEFAKGMYSRVGIVCTKYISMMSQEAQIRWILPLEKTNNTKKTSILFEPDEISVLNAVIPEYVAGIIAGCVKESFASEVAARRVAMDSAGKNAQEMLDDLGLAYNRARQGAITQEITEIVAGSGS